MANIQSPFIWYDLLTPDIVQSRTFYSSVVGWKIADAGMGGMPYDILHAGDATVGGMMSSPPGYGENGGQPMWWGYIYVEDVDAKVKEAVSLGGSICKAAEDLPGVGRFATLADPHGAVFYVFKPTSTEKPAAIAEGTPGHIGWRELSAGDGPEAWAFYSALFGWTKGEGMDMGPNGVYQLFQVDGKDHGAIMTKMNDVPKPMWNYYFNVDSIEAAITRVKNAGGKIVMGPHEVPGNSWIAVGFDPQGAMLCLVSNTK